MGRDGAVFLVPLDHAGPPPPPLVPARASVSMRATAWASQQALVTAGTTGALPAVRHVQHSCGPCWLCRQATCSGCEAQQMLASPLRCLLSGQSGDRFP